MTDQSRGLPIMAINLRHARIVDGGVAGAFLSELGIPSSARNPYLLFDSADGPVVIDAITIIQLAIAPNAGSFETILSPFRDVAVIGFDAGPAIFLSLDYEALRSCGLINGTPGTGVSGVSQLAIKAFAYWLTNDERTQAIQQLSESIKSTGPLALPRIDFQIEFNAVGLQAPGLYMVQNFVGQRGGARWTQNDKVIVAISRGKRSGKNVVSSPRHLMDASLKLFDDQTVLSYKLTQESIARLIEHLPDLEKRGFAFGPIDQMRH